MNQEDSKEEEASDCWEEEEVEEAEPEVDQDSENSGFESQAQVRENPETPIFSVSPSQTQTCSPDF